MKPTAKEIASYYKKMQIDTASSKTHIAMMHDKLYKLVSESISNRSGSRSKLDRAQNILAQFQVSLNNRGELAKSLFLLYDYVYIRLEKNEINEWRDALKVIETLKDTFNELLNRK